MYLCYTGEVLCSVSDLISVTTGSSTLHTSATGPHLLVAWRLTGAAQYPVSIHCTNLHSPQSYFILLPNIFCAHLESLFSNVINNKCFRNILVLVWILSLDLILQQTEINFPKL